MANAVEWEAPAASALLINTVTVNSVTLSGVSAEYDNATQEKRWGYAEVTIAGFAAAPTAGGLILLYLIPALDNSNYMDVDAVCIQNMLVGYSQVRNADAAHRLVIKPYSSPGFLFPIPPTKFKFIVYNGSDQNTDADALSLNFWTTNEEIQ